MEAQVSNIFPST